jgi:hypothetical protein
MGEDKDIHVASDEEPIITRYEPGFRRFYAQGSLVHNDDEDPHMVALAFWSGRQRGLKLDEDGATGTGYQLEAETIMTWEAAERLHRLLGKWLKEKRPQARHTATGE